LPLSDKQDDMLRSEIDDIASDAGAENVAVGFYDYETSTSWSYRGSEWFHAASTIKVALLAGVFRAIEEGRYDEENRLHVRNRFLSAVEGEPFRVASGRDADSEVHSRRGKTMPIGELAHHMITTSSNLATNLLLNLVGAEFVRETLDEMDVEGLDFQRGVEDEKAFEAGVNNRATADGLVALFRRIYEREVLSEDICDEMMGILYQQHFNSGIPAGLGEPDEGEVRVAHKTGEISTVAHDAGVVTWPEREPYVLAVLTEWERGNTGHRQDTLANVSSAIFKHLIRE
jgi:beta-lactamase class A